MLTSYINQYHCPRCGTKNIIDYEDTIECPRCRLEFEKSDFENFEDEDILSIEEKLDISDVFFSE
ncbi:MAG: hypothetical protein ACFFAO_13400 [Candidatus Hermodarchaeota archaeon]